MDQASFDELVAKSGERFAASLRESDRRFEGWVARMERSEQHFIEALAENSAEIKQLGAEHERHSTSMRLQMQDGRESLQALTRAVLSVLERLDRLEGGTA